MTPAEAITMINELIGVEVETTKACNSGSGRVSKALQLREHKAVSALYQALIGSKPTLEQLEEMERV